MPAPAPSFDRSRELWQRASRILPAGVSSQFRRLQRPVPLYFTDGQGCRVRDADGNQTIDYTLGWGPLVLGHSHPAVVEAVREQVGFGVTFGAQHPLEAEVAERIASMCPACERVVFQTTGTEAVHLALRLARAYTRRPLVVRFGGHYHGWLDSVLARADPERPFGAALAITEGQAPGALADVLCLPWNDLALVEEAFRIHRDRIAAVITEPLAVNGGGLWPVPGFLAGLRALCNREGALLIFDEVITGFRVRPGGASELVDVRPDLAVYGKALASGFALSAIGGRTDVLDLVAEGRVFQAGTLNGQPVALAAARATLDEISRDGGALLDHICRMGERLQAGLRATFDEAGLPLQVSGHGSVFWTFFQATPFSDLSAVALHDGSSYARFAERLLDHGVLAMQTGRWYVSAAHEPGDIDETIAAVRDLLAGHG